MNRNAAYVAHQIGKTENWVKRNAARYPHHRAGKSYFWTDDDITDMLAAMRVRPAAIDDDGALRPITGRRAS